MRRFLVFARRSAGALLAVGALSGATWLLAAAGALPFTPASVAYIDTYTHSDPASLANPAAMGATVAALDRENAARVIVLVPPFAPGDPATYDAEALAPAAKAHPDKISFLAGGGSLNPMIEESARSGEDPSDALTQKFTATAESILAQGAVGFGEMTAEHFAFTPAQSYESAPPDHPLFLLLADIAARHGVPMDLHMEAVPRPIPLSNGLSSPPNPIAIRENIRAFETLLDHNRNAKIVWSHVGWDNTGYRTADLCRRLLKAHRNLYMSIKVDPEAMGQTPLFAEDPETEIMPPLATAKIAPDWLKLFEDFPDQFVIGSDQHYGADTDLSDGPQRWQAAVLLLNQLPDKVRRKIATENALRIYPLAGGSPVPAKNAKK